MSRHYRFLTVVWRKAASVVLPRSADTTLVTADSALLTADAAP